jgi:hypothetical protein
MTGKTYIDGLDIYTRYGAFVTQGGYTSLAAFPPLKKPDFNNWQEEDGIEVDLTSPVLNTREVAVTFAAHRAPKVKDFLTKLATGAAHDFNFWEIGQTITLRMTGQSSREIVQGLELFTINFADDSPLKDYTYAAPVATSVSQSALTLDGRPMGDYGVWVLQGTEKEIRRAAEVKPNLMRNNAGKPGAFYDGQHVAFQSKEVTLRLSMVAPTLATFWRNHKALLYDLTRPDARAIYCEATGETYACYYSHAAAERFSPTEGKVWLDFTITLVFTGTRIPK